MSGYKTKKNNTLCADIIEIQTDLNRLNNDLNLPSPI